MGAGQRIEHFIQDGCELYQVYKVQELLTIKGYNLTNDVDIKKNVMINHMVNRNISDKFETSIYKSNIDKHIISFVDSLILKYNQKMDCISVEVEYRNKGLKGDFIIKYENNTIKSFSFKNYKKSFKTIQVCSGTWPSFCNKFILTDQEGNGNIGPGVFIDIHNKNFKGSSIKKRNKHINEIYNSSIASEIIQNMDILLEINKSIRDKYVKCDKTKCWTNEVACMWKNDCQELGVNGAHVVESILNMIDASKKKKVILKMCGLNKEAEELLCLDSNTMLCSIFNDEWSNLINKLDNPLTECNIVANGPKLDISFINEGDVIIDITIPFTLQKNGAWFLDEEYKETGYYHPKEKIHLNYGDRRPKKSREISTSINTFFSLYKCGLYD